METKDKGRGHEEADFPSGDLEECDLLKTFFGLQKLTKLEKGFKVGTLFSNWRMSLNVFQTPC